MFVKTKPKTPRIVTSQLRIFGYHTTLAVWLKIEIHHVNRYRATLTGKKSLPHLPQPDNVS